LGQYTRSFHVESTVLSVNGIQAAPVRSKSKGEYIGWVSQYDIVAYILRLFSNAAGGEIQWSSYVGDLKAMEHRGLKFGKTNIRAVMSDSLSSAFKEVESTLPLSDVLTEFFTMGTQKLAVSFNDMLIDVITPMDIILFVARIGLGTFANKTIEELGIGSKSTTRVKWNSPAIHAFYMMWYLNIPSVAVVDSQERLMTTISASDVKRIGTLDLPQLINPIASFQAKHKPLFLPPVIAQWNTPICTIVQQMSLFRIHQVYIVNNDHMVTGVVTVQDVCHWIYDQLMSQAS